MEVGTPKVKPRLARIRATPLVPLEGEGNPKANLAARSTAQKTYLLPAREVVPITCGSASVGTAVGQDVEARVLRDRRPVKKVAYERECGAYCEELGDHTTGYCDDWFVAVECIPY